MGIRRVGAIQCRMVEAQNATHINTVDIIMVDITTRYTSGALLEQLAGLTNHHTPIHPHTNFRTVATIRMHNRNGEDGQTDGWMDG
jgi:hypothetical protein